MGRDTGLPSCPRFSLTQVILPETWDKELEIWSHFAKVSLQNRNTILIISESATISFKKILYLIRDCSFKVISNMLLSLLIYVLLRQFFYFYSSSNIQHIYWWYFQISLRLIWAMEFSSYNQPLAGASQWLHSKKAHCGNDIVLMTFWLDSPHVNRCYSLTVSCAVLTWELKDKVCSRCFMNQYC